MAVKVHLLRLGGCSFSDTIRHCIEGSLLCFRYGTDILHTFEMWRTTFDVNLAPRRNFAKRRNPLESMSEIHFYDRYIFPELHYSGLEFAAHNGLLRKFYQPRIFPPDCKLLLYSLSYTTNYCTTVHFNLWFR